MAELDPIDNDVASFFDSGGNLPESLTPQPAVEPPAPPPAQPVAAPPAPPAEDPSLGILRTQLGQLQNYSAQLERSIQEMQKQQAPADPPPDADTDPLGHMMHEVAEVKKLMAEMTGKMQQQEAMGMQQQQLQAFVSEVQGLTTQFMQKVPDYAQAYNYLRGIRMQDMKDMGLNDASAKEALLREELSVAATAMGQGRVPAQMIYEIAKRYGYRAQAAPATPTARMDALQKGAAAAPSGITPSAPPIDLSIDAVKDMSSDQMDRLVENDDLWHKTVGGTTGGNSIFH